MDTFLEKYNLPKLNEEEPESRRITPDEIETAINKLLTHKCLGPDASTREFYKAFRKR